MKKRLIQALGFLAAAMMLSTQSLGYDQQLAQEYNAMFKPVVGAKAGKFLHLIKPDQFVERVRKGEEFTTVDIRTPGETRFFTGNLPGHLTIPLSELFEDENLARLPEQGNIVIFCKSGTRATAAATALRSIGFKQTYVMKGGLQGLSAYMGPKEANGPKKTKTTAR